MSTFAVIGHGELGRALAQALAARVYERGGTASLEEMLEGAECVIAAVPVAAAAEVAGMATAYLAPGALYVDPSPALPEAKEELERVLARVGALYVDAAILGTTAADGAAVPILAAGPGAARFAELAAALDVTVLEGPAGAATRVKLLRSVFMKGRDALIAEMLVAARRFGLDEAVVGSVKGGGEQAPFPELARRVMTALAIHAERRADEVAASAEILRQAGVEPLLASASEARLRRLAALGLRERFAGERPGSLDEVLAAIEELSAGVPPGSESPPL